MGKKNKVVKLTDRKIRYIIRAKKRGENTNRIAEDMKLSPSTVKRVWMHWTKTKMQLNIKKFGRKKKTLDSVRTQAQPVHGASGLAHQHSRREKGVRLRGP
ncbi:MAG: hypothetical protein NTU95_07060 [Methanothrix sp.]|nr:hypothetical protein [Methanothrix sp.]